MFTGGDSDTIGAVAGGILGAYYAENIWEEIEHLVEEQYVPELEDVITYMESL
jgi:ADP-ribosylglycohydrolase